VLLLLPAVGDFLKSWNIPFNLACYCSQLYRFEEAQDWLFKAILANEKKVNHHANDSDLKPLWKNMGLKTFSPQWLS